MSKKARKTKAKLERDEDKIVRRENKWKAEQEQKKKEKLKQTDKTQS